MVTYGGDEVSAIVIDFGSHTTRAGYAGEDTPKAVVPSFYGYKDVDAPAGTEGGEGGKIRKHYVGEDGVGIWREGMEVGNVFKDGIVTEPSALPPLVSHILHHHLHLPSASPSDPSGHPILTSESSWTPPSQRTLMAELFFEQENVPAWYTACGGVLSAFASGKGTALVVDVGREATVVTPVIEGYVLRSGTKRQPTGMDLIHNQSKSFLKAQAPPARAFPLSLTPFQLIKDRTPVPSGVAPRFTAREDREAGTTTSWREWAEGRVVENWREATGAVYEARYDERLVSQRPTRPFEFPDGYNANFGSERFKLAEMLFDPRFRNDNIPPTEAQLGTPSTPNSRSYTEMVSIPQLIHESLTTCDVDVRASLLQNIVIVGGGSLLPGFTDRLNYELSVAFPGQKVRLHASGHPTERRYSSWLGGSILASLGTFHQLWISKEEWEEYGPNIVGQKCK